MINNRTAPRGRALTPQTLKKYKITHKMIADWFNYSSENSFSGSRKGKRDILYGIQEVIRHIESFK